MPTNHIMYNRGRVECEGDVMLETVVETPGGLIGPWIRTTCKGCSLEHYTRQQ